MEIQSSYLYQYKKYPKFIEYTEPGVLKTSTGKKYYDMQSFVCSTSLWHKGINIQNQFDALPTSYEYPNDLRDTVTKKLVALCKPDKMQLCYAASGTDAVTNAINLARQTTKKRFVFMFNNQYHGKYGTLSGRTSVMIQQQMRGEDIVVLPAITDPSTATEVLAQFHTLLTDSIYTNNTAAVVLELVPIANGGGIPLDSSIVTYLHDMLVDHNIKLIIDEVQSGFWRTGKVFSYKHYKELHPFAIAFGKSISGGLPLYGTFFNSKELPESLSKGFYSSTFAFNNVSGSAALQVLQHIGDVSKFEEEIEAKGCAIDMELAGIFPKQLYQRVGLLISFPCDKPASFFLKFGIVVRVIKGRLVLTPPLFTDKTILAKTARRIKDAIYVRLE